MRSFGPAKTSRWVEAFLAKLRNTFLATFAKPCTISVAHDAVNIGKPTKEYSFVHQDFFKHDANVLLSPQNLHGLAMQEAVPTEVKNQPITQAGEDPSKFATGQADECITCCLVSPPKSFLNPKP